MGQVAVAAGYRGQRVFDRMYAKLREAYMDRYDFVATEVSARNGRSLAAHYRVGFKDLVCPDPVTQLRRRHSAFCMIVILFLKTLSLMGPSP